MPFLPDKRRGQTPGGKGRFPGFDTVAQAGRWDDVTAGVVLARLAPSPDYSFFTPVEQACADVLFDRLLAQNGDPKVPVLQLVDQRLALDMTDGWFYEGMPEDREAWRLTLAALDEESLARAGAVFAALDLAAQGALLQSIVDAEEWRGWPAGHVWSLWSRYACAAFYSHPWAWNEIGFGGP
ncbi:MAG: gluconate 2-dehydrogenase subunit 3 family protein, partial [Acidimicrobiales bacterium]